MIVEKQENKKEFIVDPNYREKAVLVSVIRDSQEPREAMEFLAELEFLAETANIETRPLWKPMHLQPVFADAPFYGDGTSEKLFDDGLCLPSGTSLTNEEIGFVIETILKTLNK